eukprot:gene27736-33500_t
MHKPMPKLIRLFAALLLLALGLGSAWAQRMYDSSGRQLGRIDAQRYFNASGQQIGRVDGERIYDASGRQLGRIDGERVYDASGRQMGRIDGERLYSASGSLMGRLDGERIYDASGRQGLLRPPANDLAVPDPATAAATNRPPAKRVHIEKGQAAPHHRRWGGGCTSVRTGPPSAFAWPSNR